MSTLAYTLVLLCVSLTLVSALPTARRFDRDDVLAGGDFLSVFMRRGDRLRTRHRAQGPFEHGQDHDRELNSVSAKTTLLDLVKPFPDKYTITDIFKTSKYGYEVNEMPSEQGDYQTNVPTHENEVKTTTQYTEPTTIEDIPTTVPYAFERIHKLPTLEQTTVPTTDEVVTQVELTTPKQEMDKIEEKVIEVRVSSSVARHSHRAVETSTTKTISEVIPRAKLVDDNLVSTLVTQEQPKIQLVQRSDFAVEEAPLLSAEAASHQEQRDQRSFTRPDEVEGKVQEVTRYGVEQPKGLHRKLPVFELHFHNPPAALVSSYESKPESLRSEDHQPQTFKRKEFRQLSHYGRHSEPISYHSRVSSPTSDSSVNFYREHHNNRAVAETVQQPVISEPYPPASYQQQNQDQPKDSIPPSAEQQHQESSTYHEEPSERVYGEAEKVYGQPEQNYEVDEAVSVITNGKAHGVQGPTAPPTQSQDQANQNKFGYVVEGRNFRKYRVEERTNDGFIVGEYGVVSHDDGSLRGVRYTADSTINPRLIYDTLVKFLSL